MAEGITNSLDGKVVDSLFGVAKKEISYFWNCNQIVEMFRNEAENLKHMRGRVQQRIDLAEMIGDELVDGVLEWVTKADYQISMAEEFLHEEAFAKKTCFNLRLCVNLGVLHHYGKMAADKAPSLVQHQEDGKAYGSDVFIPTSTPGFLDRYEKKNLDDLDTHKLALGKVIEAIEDKNIQIIGIYGIGGVGKTTLVKEVAARVNHLFACVVFITVSQTVDATRIKKEVEAAAKQIIKGDKILIILDDMWKELKLDEVGIPCGIDHMNCKILLTTRKRDVCVAMDAQTEIWVDSLPEEEAWILFKRVVGERVETDDQLNRVAMMVAKGCGGLPLIVQAVGRALKNESIRSWETALAQLEKHAPSDIDPDISLAFTHLKLSYDYLESEEAKSCFLLCSMFPEDSNIRLERLAYYGMGLEIFKDLDSMKSARNRVQLAVKTLKSSSLLLDGDDELTTKMHDIVREVALLIANKQFLVQAGKHLTEWQPRNKTVESCTGISLMQNNICKLPDYELQMPLLDIFLIQENCNLSTISDKFARGMKEAKVLDIEHNNISSLPQSMKLLTRLRMLNLGGNRSLCEVSILGELRNLEILILNHTGIKEIPQEIGQLANLRRLEVKCCHDLSHIAPGVISKLRWLEELYIGYYPVEEGNYNSLAELGKLLKLTFIDLFVPHTYLIPEGYDFGTLNGFVIQIGGSEHISNFALDRHLKGILVLGMPYLYIPPSQEIKRLIKISDGIVLESNKNLYNIMPTIYCEGVDELKSIVLTKCNNILCLVDLDYDQMQNFLPSIGPDGQKIKKKFFSELEHLNLSELNGLNVIWNCPDQYISLNNLVTLEISDCHKLVRLFSVTVAHGLVNLQTLTIRECSFLEEVIWDVDKVGAVEKVEQAASIVFPRLTMIFFFHLSKLKSFYSGHSTIKYPSLVDIFIPDCDAIYIWGSGVQYTPKLKHLHEVSLKGPCDINNAIALFHEDDATEKELSALKSIIKCIEDHTLENQYPVDPLQKRILHLEMSKPSKNEPQKFRNPYSTRNLNFHARVTDRYPPPSQYMYDNRPYGYHGPTDNHIPSFMSGVTYNMAPNHGTYYGNGYQYQAAYIH